jgi:branched-subunit amino acid aminotransferase/4-amino-4-deoxychorismate lyase
MTRALALIDDRIVAEEEATVFWNDPGFRRGYGVFETILVANGWPFLAGLHALRLTNGAPKLGIDPWMHPRTLVRRLKRLIRDSGTVEGVARVFLTPGPAPAGEAPGIPEITGAVPGGRAHRARYVATITTRHMPPPFVRAIIAPNLRDAAGPLVGIKTLSYAEEQLLLSRAQAAGADEALRRNLQGRITEGTGSNVFLINGRSLITPPISEGILPGITRWFVLRTGPDDGYEPREEPVTVEALFGAEEAFITSTTRGIVPLVSVDGRPIGTGKPGPKALRLAAILERHMRRGKEIS